MGEKSWIDVRRQLRAYLRVIVSREVALCVLLAVAGAVIARKLGLDELGVSTVAVIVVLCTRLLEQHVSRWRSSRIWLLTFLFFPWERGGRIIEWLRGRIGLSPDKALTLVGWQAQVVSVVGATAITFGTFAASEATLGSSPLSGDGSSRAQILGFSGQDWAERGLLPRDVVESGGS
jgi:hypothetical protein